LFGRYTYTQVPDGPSALALVTERKYIGSDGGSGGGGGGGGGGAGRAGLVNRSRNARR